jgi:ubiquinol-cytochrome c reductase cytochrome b subunit
VISSLLNWLDDRTGYRDIVREALYEDVPGGSRWRYVWGSTLVFTFSVQVITGIFLWMSYSPSAQTAWESVYYIQHVMQGGWMLRGIHHFTAHAMVVLLALHLWQVVIDGAYRAPREVNFWLGLVLMLIVLGLSLTGYLLPWDQKGYWATQVATKIMGLAPGGEYQQKSLVGGVEYGHHTLTRFFALHAGVLPGLLVLFLALHIYVFRRHGLHYKQPKARPDGTFWPDQVFKDAVACLATLAVILALVFYFQGAELMAPADAANPYAAARPEWYFLFLFQFLKLFPGRLEAIGAIYVPGLVMVLMAAMPLVGRWKLGHWFNCLLLASILTGAGVLTFLAVYEDRGADALWLIYVPGSVLALLFIVHLFPHQPVKFYSAAAVGAVLLAAGGAALWYLVRDHRGNLAYRNAVWEAEQYAAVAEARASRGIPASGAGSMMRRELHSASVEQLARVCFSCHAYTDAAGHGFLPEDISAPNLHGFGTAAWVRGLLDKERVVGPDYLAHVYPEESQMIDYVVNQMQLKPEEIDKVALALESEAGRSPPGVDHAAVAAGRQLIHDNCTDCHRFRESEGGGIAPDLTGWGSIEWIAGMIHDPNTASYYAHLEGTVEDPETGRSEAKQRMPAFGLPPQRNAAPLLDAELIEDIAAWLHGDWPPAGELPWRGDEVEQAAEADAAP